MTLANQCRIPVTLKTRMTPPTKMPAVAIEPSVKLRAIATAAIAFIGWTGSGIPKHIPVRMLKMPEKTNVLAREIVPFAARAMAMGRNVPRSPRDPEISET
jgi:hypothetical protein